MKNIQKIYKLLGNNPELGSINIIGGACATGKSTFAVNFACDYIEQGKDVLFITCSEPESYVLKKTYSCLNKKSIKSFYENYIPEFKKEYIGHFFIKKMIPSLAEKNFYKNIELILEKHKLNGFIPDVLIIDESHYLKNNFWKLRELAIDLNIPIIVTLQTKNIDDDIFCFSSTEPLFIANTVMKIEINKIKILKNRYGKQRFDIPIKMDFKYSTFNVLERNILIKITAWIKENIWKKLFQQLNKTVVCAQNIFNKKESKI